MGATVGATEATAAIAPEGQAVQAIAARPAILAAAVIRAAVDRRSDAPNDLVNKRFLRHLHESAICDSENLALHVAPHHLHA